MNDRYREKTASAANNEDRRKRRAFGKAMAAGLKSVFDPVTARSVPDEFMQLLEMADKRGSSGA